MAPIRIITISREYGSAGRQIGEQVANALGIPFYDKALIALTAEKSGFSPDYIRQTEESAIPSLLFGLSAGGYPGGLFTLENMHNEASLFIAQSLAIRELAEKGPCVIVGRCADYVLRERSDCLNAFIHADTASKLRRLVEEYGVAPQEAEGVLKKRNKARAGHYHRFTGSNWADPRNYHITLHSGFLGTDACADLVCGAARTAR